MIYILRITHSLIYFIELGVTSFTNLQTLKSVTLKSVTSLQTYKQDNGVETSINCTNDDTSYNASLWNALPAAISLCICDFSSSTDANFISLLLKLRKSTLISSPYASSSKS